MKRIAFLPGFISILFVLGINLPANSQVSSDGTTNTTVNLNGNNFNILNGIQKGNNLFHSFREFSIPTGSEATFDNSTDVVNIINRITGGNISNIDGLIKANGNANLFLINPAGIVFGENARLDIGGSFLGSTAESILFEDGFEFSAVNSQSEPLLTVSVPVGLQMGQNPGDIQVNGSGHTLTARHPQLSPISRGEINSGLQVSPGRTLALLGGNVNLSGAVVAVNSGRIELGSVDSGVVRLNGVAQGWELGYSDVQGFRDIILSQRSLADASGFLRGGSIQVQGRNLSLGDGSVVLVQNLGEQASGAIRVNASESVQITGLLPDTNIASGLFKETLGSGAAGDIEISTQKLTLQDGGVITARTFSEARGGNIIVNASESIEIIGLFFPNSPIRTAFFSSTFGSGDAGEVTASTERLIISNGGILSTSTFGTGDAGDITIDATESIEIIGATPVTNRGSAVSASTFSGDAGNIVINTQQLGILDGGRVTSGTAASGTAGSITLNASEFIEVSGKAPETEIFSQVSSSATSITNPALVSIFQLPPVPDGISGNVTINTPVLSVTDGADISVSNAGSNNAGDLRINANSVFVDRQGTITASTASGEGGNIDLQVRNSLQLRRQSGIEAEAGGTGNGGNITINSPIIAGFENSDIIANAVEGNGGNIDITTQGIFGLEFRDELTPENDITASSQFGVNGTVDINNLDIDPSSGLVELPQELTDSSQKVAQGCSSNADSSFVATGRGGIPQNPRGQIDANPNWSDIRDLSAYRQQNNHDSQVINSSNKPAIVEATGFIRHENGEIELVALQNNPLKIKQVADCSANNT